MAKINLNFLKLTNNYLFSEIEERIKKMGKSKISILNLGIGDVTKPVSNVILEAFKGAVEELKGQVKGYGPSEGEEFLRRAIRDTEYKDFEIDEIFISDGSKNDIAGIQELFSCDSIVGICDPSYPVYYDSNIIAGREKIVWLPCIETNNFLPVPPEKHCDIIYLCSPHNPTGMAFTYEELKRWIEYAKKNKSIILYDSAYEAFIREHGIPKSIYEIEGAEEVAIEFRSFSKSAGFTAIRLSYYVIPKKLEIEGGLANLLWRRRTDAKYGGASYPIQKGSMALYSMQGKNIIREITDEYLKGAGILKKGLQEVGFEVWGGENSPYVWCKSFSSSWKFFDMLLEKTGIICIPGSGFVSVGEGFVRFSGFDNYRDIKEALLRIKKNFNKADLEVNMLK